MADSRSIVITLKLSSDKDEADTSNQTDTDSAATKSDSDKKAKAAYRALAAQAVQVSVQEVVAWTEYYWNRELTLSDDYIGQRNKNVAITQINRATSAIGTVANFTMVGSAAGPWGAAIGAALGIAVATAGIVRSNLQGQDQQNIQLKQMNVQLNFTRSRAGWSINAGSIGEDL